MVFQILSNRRWLIQFPFDCESYKEYLLGDWWRSRKAQAIRDAGYKCEQCGSMNRLEVHHLNYQNLGNEGDDDLVMLCRKCHEGWHKK